MNSPLSIIVTCKNAAGNIANTIESIRGLSNDIVIYDTGSTDKTLAIARKYAVQIYTGSWEGYGKTRNKSIEKAKHDWVFIIDSDEIAEPALQEEVALLTLHDPQIAYAVRLRNFLGKKEFKWGDWGRDDRVRLFHRAHIQWDNAIIHEKLVLPANTKIKKLEGRLLHKNAGNIKEYSEKLRVYALLTAEKYYSAGKSPTWIRRYFSAAYTFIKIYFLRAGFLDGSCGFAVARLFARYTFLKYARLYELRRRKVD